MAFEVNVLLSDWVVLDHVGSDFAEVEPHPFCLLVPIPLVILLVVKAYFGLVERGAYNPVDLLLLRIIALLKPHFRFDLCFLDNGLLIKISDLHHTDVRPSLVADVL